MGQAVAKLNLDALGRFIGLGDRAEIIAVLPPGYDDCVHHNVTVIMDSNVFPPVGMGMALPEVDILYNMTERGIVFGGFKFRNEPQEPGDPVHG